jgi:hypothetical protein
VSEVHPEQASPAHAETAFGFFRDLGFDLVGRRVTGGNSFRDGWQLTYQGPSVLVIVQYMDSQLEIHFARGDQSAEYLFIDRELFGRRSGLGGNMFPPHKLAPIVDRLASDIRDNYGPILGGDDQVWTRIKQLREVPLAKDRKLP